MVFQYDHDKAGATLAAKLSGFTGTLGADAEHRHNATFADDTILEAGCNAHGERKLEAAEQTRPALAAQGRAFDGTVFLTTTTGESITPNRMTQLVRGYIEASGVPKKGSCNVLRHTMATLMLEDGADSRYIQAMSGHVSLETTQIYTQVSIRALVNVHAATHPAAGLVRAAKEEEEAEAEPTEDDLHAALEAEERDDPEE